MPIFTARIRNLDGTSFVGFWGTLPTTMDVITDSLSISGDIRGIPRWVGQVSVPYSPVLETFGNLIQGGTRMQILKDGTLWADLPITGMSGGWSADGGNEPTTFTLESDEVRISDQVYTGADWTVPTISDPNRAAWAVLQLPVIKAFRDEPKFDSNSAVGSAPLAIANTISILSGRNILNWFLECGNLIGSAFGSNLLGVLSYWPPIDRGLITRDQIRADLRGFAIGDYYNEVEVEASLPGGQTLTHTISEGSWESGPWMRRLHYTIPEGAWTSANVQQIAKELQSRTRTRTRERVLRIHPRYDLSVGDFITIPYPPPAPMSLYNESVSRGTISRITFTEQETILTQTITELYYGNSWHGQEIPARRWSDFAAVAWNSTGSLEIY